ncbi:MAG: hypothetical protein Q4F84_01170 [Fibrobacter sp.]|nr:hypothetical protein [Fibrobacter sp.]
MLRRIFILISVGLVVGAYANGAETSNKKLMDKLESIMAKAGISIGGEFKSQYFSSSIDGAGVDSSARQRETNEFTSVDFDIKARPNEAISARVMFRMHQNWQNFFSDVSNPIFSRWISIDGNPMGMFRFNVGDFKEKYSPLTLYSPEIDILYEPYIFARQRELAMNELFIGDNYRVLQGLNFGIDAEVAPIFNEFHLGVLATRLAGTETNIQNGSFVVADYQKTDMSKYLGGLNLDLTFLNGIDFGGTWMIIFDHKGSYKEKNAGDTMTADTMAQKTNIFSLRPGINFSKLFDWSESFNLRLKTEFAVSSDDSAWVIDSAGFNVVRTKNEDGTTKKDTVYYKDLSSTSITGAAIDIGAEIGYSSENWGIKVNGDFISNDRDFRNTMAQSPTFYGSRIMNYESDMMSGDGSLYTTFDALYHSVFKFTPSKSGNNWAKAPFFKSSYYRGVLLNQQSLNDFMTGDKFDPSLQLVMPLGPATPNRSGIDADGKVWFFDGGIEASGLLSILSEKEWCKYGVIRPLKPDSTDEGFGDPFDAKEFGKKYGYKVVAYGYEKSDLPELVDDSGDVVMDGFQKTEYSQMGMGLKFNLEKFTSIFEYPFELSASVVKSTATNAGMVKSGKPVGKWEINSAFTNMGLYYKFWKRMAVLGGYQIINNTAMSNDVEVKQTQKQWSAGVEWKINDGADVVGSVGQIIAEVDTLTSWYPECGLSADGGNFKQFLIDVSLRVKF